MGESGKFEFRTFHILFMINSSIGPSLAFLKLRIEFLNVIDLVGSTEKRGRKDQRESLLGTALPAIFATFPLLFPPFRHPTLNISQQPSTAPYLSLLLSCHLLVTPPTIFWSTVVSLPLISVIGQVIYHGLLCPWVVVAAGGAEVIKLNDKNDDP